MILPTLRFQSVYGPGVARDADRGRRDLAEVRDDQAGLDEDDVDAEALDLKAQRVADRLHGVLGRVVQPTAGEGEAAAHRADVDDLAAPLFTHPGEDELAHPDETEHVRLELAPHVLERHGLDGAGLAVAGVVDEHADRTLDVGHGLDRRLHRRFIGDVERQRLGTLGGQFLDRLGAARRRVDGEAIAEQPLCRRLADPGGAACDQDHFGVGRHGGQPTTRGRASCT